MCVVLFLSVPSSTKSEERLRLLVRGRELDSLSDSKLNDSHSDLSLNFGGKCFSCDAENKIKQRNNNNFERIEE